MSLQARTSARRRSGSAREYFCDLCRAEAPHRHLYNKGGFAILRCCACGLVKTEVPSGGIAFDRIYDGSYFEGGQADGYTDYGASRPVLARQARRILRLIASYRPCGRLLEIGCAYGFFLEQAARLYEVTGIDLSAHAVEQARARGLNVTRGTIEDVDLPSESFDVIAILETLEHLPSPFATLAEARRASRPGAVLVVSTGDVESVLARLCGRAWRLMTPPQHLYFFSRRTLAKVARRTGWRPVRIEYSWRYVPIGLAAYQFCSRVLGWRRVPIPVRVGIPVNLYDVITLVAVRM